MNNQNNQYKKQIGIIGGTFDPIHYGHLIAASWARECLSLEKVIFMPAGTPPHKLKNNVLDPIHRYNMVLLAINDQPYFEVSSLEINRKGPSYTIDSARELTEKYREESTRILFIVGADSILELHTWKDYKKLLSKYYFIAVSREGYEKKQFYKRIEEIHNIYGKRIYNVEIPAIGISSTKLREMVKSNKSIRYLLPPSVEQYIKENSLYK
ncbi:MAG TPA: nicotinate-nucleotide adenylyltransferase [Eubacteriaceae bacterium]|nr:nicotinate-nucleotide adenylyltransferase [Eubacteriaceae bacterium]